MKHIGHRYQQSSTAALEERVRVLEGRVAALADAARVLAHGLEDLPTAEPGQRPAAEAARRAYDLLLVAETRPPAPETHPAEGHQDT
jgi:hypothetical protein